MLNSCASSWAMRPRPLTDLPLTDVFRFDAGTPALQEGIALRPAADPAAAVELMARALSRTLAARDCLADPASVRALLQLRLGALPMRSSRCCCSMRRTA
jgi:DNA repair protein RadC